MLTMMFFAHRATYPNIFVLLFALLGGNGIYAGWQPALSDLEQEQLSSLAKREHQTQQRTADKSDSDVALGIEVLMVELQEKKSRKPTDALLAEVFVFDYSTNRASVQLIDVDTHELVSTRGIEHIHLPLNQRERDVTHQILLENRALISQLENEYIEQFGQQLISIAQLDMKVSIWEPGANDTQASFCDETRCALVSIFTHDSYNFSVEPIVELHNAVVHLDLIQ